MRFSLLTISAHDTSHRLKVSHTSRTQKHKRATTQQEAVCAIMDGGTYIATRKEEWEKMVNLPILYSTLSPTEEEKEACDSHKVWRRNFMDGHNRHPCSLANALYPEPIILLSEAEYANCTVIPGDRREKSSTGPVAAELLEKTAKSIFKALGNKFVLEMEHAGLQLVWNKTKRHHWYRGLEPSPRIHEARFARGARIQFYCVECVESGRCGLVANGRFHMKGASESCDIRDYSLEIEEIYYHCSECSAFGSRTSFNREYERSGHVIIPGGIDWVLGQRYKDVVQVIEDWPKAGYFFSPDLSKEEKGKILRQWPNLEPSKPEVANKWLSCGELINFNCPEYRYDDRAYLLLPGTPLGEVLKPGDHFMSMARLLYVIVCRMGIESEVSPFLFDESKFCKMWAGSNPETKQYKNYRGLFKDNDAAHISMKEISALFGGNEREICGPDVVHQYCHVDGMENISLPDNGNGFIPCSLILPLSPDGRKIYIRNPSQTVNIPFGSMILFAANLPHGGVTTRLANGTQRVAIHGHLDSKWVGRKGGLLDLARIGDNYVAEQHLMLYNIGDHMQHLFEIHELFLKRCREFHRKRENELDDIVKNPERHGEDTRSVARRYKAVVSDLKKTTTFGFLEGNGKKKRKRTGCSL